MKVIEIRVQPETHRIKLTVEMPDPDRYLTSQVPHLPRQLFQLFPHMAQHKCENGMGLTFRQECRETEIPHLLEHLIMELQLQAQPDEELLLRGETEWNWYIDPRGLFHVYVDYANQLLAVGAIRLAVIIINALDQREIERIDTPLEMQRLRELARLGREISGEASAPMPPAPVAVAVGRPAPRRRLVAKTA